MLVQRDVNEALKLMNKPRMERKAFDRYSIPYIFGTESQEGVNQVVDYNEKDVLTLASSGDQYLGAVYYGAKDVDLYDINKLTYYITTLKIAAIKILDYRSFMAFFVPVVNGKPNRWFWNKLLLKKVMKDLPADSAAFWDNIIYEMKKRGIEQFVYVDLPYHSKDIIKRGMPFYANKEEYYKLQDILRKREYPSFTQTDVLNLKECFVDQYDIVYLSNIIENMAYDRCVQIARERAWRLFDAVNVSCLDGAEEKAFKEIVDKMCEQVIPLLTSDGVAVMDYRQNKNCTQADDIIFTNDYFDISEISSKNLGDPESRFSYANKDLVLTYRPSKTGIWK